MDSAGEIIQTKEKNVKNSKNLGGKSLIRKTYHGAN